tara:strand:+ start:95 stop:313 length:219 start_codon:yes stop_codon:yes gene_type:complete
MGIEWVKENQKRTEFMNELYELDGRDGDHPKKGTFTGLYEEYLIYLKWSGYFFPDMPPRQNKAPVRETGASN